MRNKNSIYVEQRILNLAPETISKGKIEIPNDMNIIKMSAKIIPQVLTKGTVYGRHVYALAHSIRATHWHIVYVHPLAHDLHFTALVKTRSEASIQISHYLYQEYIKWNVVHVNHRYHDVYYLGQSSSNITHIKCFFNQ